jgi:phosphate transport system protein
VSEHTLRVKGRDLDHLTDGVARIGGLAEAEMADAIQAIARRDPQLAQAVIRRDAQLDRLASEIEAAAMGVLTRYEPMADDLRRAVCALKIAGNIARCGDLARNIAERAILLAGIEPIPPLTRSVERMGRLVVARLKEVLDAFCADDVDRATSVWRRDEEIDGHYDSLFREHLTYMMADPRTITACAHLLFVAKNLERAGDHATNIAEVIHFQFTGREVDGERPKVDSLAS